MQPTQADQIAAASAFNDAQQEQKGCLDRQITSLHVVSVLLDEMGDSKEVAYSYFHTALALAARDFVLAYTDELAGRSESLASSIAHNERVLQAAQSNIVIPGLHAKLQNM